MGVTPAPQEFALLTLSFSIIRVALFNSRVTSGHTRELKRLHARVRKLIAASPTPLTSGGPATDQLADLQDEIRALEQRMTAIGEDVIALQREAVDERDVARALAVFDPVWESLAPREQARIFRLLIERVACDGRDGKVTVTFRSAGVKALCSEVGLHNSEEPA